MPKAYVVAMIQVNNMEGMSPYMAGVEGTVMEHGGRFLVRHMGEKLYTEDDPNPITVVIEFPNSEAAMNWKKSDNYQAIVAHRLDNSEGPFVICDGVE
ncbi:DUF1330 domain-containing protein [uncultured Ilumatobacter sp.]|jgi:uncharacterized protein (DUF1330 family)|uniref:DUF1330 domain-containing protein n=1 Tax=uncultured Ilumatobacter sp. TaxID=879968 RepID=UPI00374FBA24